MSESRAYFCLESWIVSDRRRNVLKALDERLKRLSKDPRDDFHDQIRRRIVGLDEDGPFALDDLVVENHQPFTHTTCFRV